MQTPPARLSLREYLTRRHVRKSAIRVDRVRRLTDRHVVVAAYGLGGLTTCPDEIVDLSDGTRVCEWSSEERVTRGGWIEPFRVRFATEDDMWRGLHARAAARADLRRYLPGLGTESVSTWMPSHLRTTTTTTTAGAREWSAVDVARVARSAKLLDDCSSDKETRAGFDHPDGARDAYTDRTGVLVDPSELAQLRVVVIAISGEADDRALDSLGRPNGGRAKGGRAGTRSPMAAPAKSARTR